MTIEQAKQNIKEHCYFANLLPQAKESLDIAIKSLEMWNKFSDEIEELLDKQYCEKKGKVQDNLAEGFLQSEKAIKRRIKEIKKEIEE